MQINFKNKIKSIRTIFLFFIFSFFLIVSLPLFLAGISLIDKITYNLGSQILGDKLQNLIEEVDNKYQKLYQIGLEDSQMHRDEIRVLSLEKFAKFSYGNSGKVFVIENTGKLILSGDFSDEQQQGYINFYKHLNMKKEGVCEYLAGEKKFAFFKYYKNWNAFIGISINQEELFSPKYQFIWVNFVVLVVIFIISFVIMIFFNSLIISPLVKLSKYAGEIAAGNYNSKIQGMFFFEILILKNTIENMVIKIREKINETIEQLATIQKREEERDIALKELKTSENRLKSIINNANAVIFLKDIDGRFVTINNKFKEICNLSEEKVIGKTVFDIFPFEIASLLAQNDKKIIDTQRHQNFEEKVMLQGKYYTYLAIKFPLIDSDGKVYAIAGISTDITDRKRMEEQLAAEQEKLSVTLQSIADGVITTDINGKVILINKVATELTGWSQEESVNMNLNDIFKIYYKKTGKVCPDIVKQTISAGHIHGCADSVLFARDGTEMEVNIKISPIRDNNAHIIGSVLVFRDVTEYNRMQEEILKMRKIESVGVLAGGIAHDFNNLLTVMLGNVSLVMHKLGENSDVYKLLTSVEKALDRSKGLTSQLLTFSKGGAPVKDTMDIKDIIHESVEFILHGSNIAPNFVFDDDLWLVDIDKNQISQVMQNIVINAAHAMPDGGIIDITAKNFVFLNEGANPLLPLKKGNYVKISIADYGKGISSEYIDKIFDLYFTTKDTGSGLGLAISHSIIAKHHGHISVKSALGKGTVFDIYIPASEEQQTDMPDFKENNLNPVQFERLKILIMDDEEEILGLIAEYLEYKNHEVCMTKNGKEAVEAYKINIEQGSLFDLVIMDLTIPGGMGGKEAASEILKIDKNAKLVVSSGYANDPVVANHRNYGFIDKLNKPYNLKDFDLLFHRLFNK